MELVYCCGGDYRLYGVCYVSVQVLVVRKFWVRVVVVCSMKPVTSGTDYKKGKSHGSFGCESRNLKLCELRAAEQIAQAVLLWFLH